MSCQCKENTWRHDKLLGAKCFPCPIGGNCDEGKDNLASPSVEYWAQSKTAHFDNKTVKVLAILDLPGAESIPDDPPIFLNCGKDVDGQPRCLGGFVCADGYEGTLCSRCELDRFYWKATCTTKCSDVENIAAVTVFGIIGVVLLWIVLNKSASGSYECLDVGISYIQILSAVFTFNGKYQHGDVYNFIVTVSNLINIDPDYVSPSCLLRGREWTYEMGFYLLLIVPLIPLAISGGLVSIAWAWQRFNGRRPAKMGCLSFDILCETPEQVAHFGARCLKETLPFVGVVYNNICLKSFATFNCISLRDGTRVLSNAPSIVCYDSYAHNVMVGISILALIFYIFGYPCFVIALTSYLKATDALRKRNWLLVFGKYYQSYQPEYIWWGSVFLLRRFALCLCAVVFASYASAQAGVATFVIIVLMLAQFKCSPYWDYRSNALDVMCCLSIATHCIAALYFNNSEFIDQHPESAKALDIILDILNIGIWAATLLLFSVVFIEERFRWWSARRVATNVADAVWKLHDQCKGEMATQFFDQLEEHLAAYRADHPTADDTIPREVFQKAAISTYEKNGIAASKGIIDASFLILKYADKSVNWLKEHVDDGELDGLGAANATQAAVGCLCFGRNFSIFDR
jgi:hypothetical protein